MIDIKMDSMAVCKLNFDVESEDDFENYSDSNMKNFSPDFDMEELPEDHSFPAGWGIKQPNGRLFSPRKKPLSIFQNTENSSINNSINQDNGSSPNNTSTTPSYRGFISPTNSISPPDKKVQALRLFDSPNTPKTLLQKSAARETPSDSGRLRHSMSRPSTRSRLFTSSRGRHAPSNSGGFGSSCTGNSSFEAIAESMDEDKTSSKTSGKDSNSKPNLRANINPFTPTNIMLSSRKRARKAKKLSISKEDCSSTPLHNNNNNLLHESMEQDGSSLSMSESSNASDDSSDDDDDENPCKRIAIHDVNVSRYNKEFLENSVIGMGVFGSVYLCRHRLDGCLYAIKRSLKPVAGSSSERRALNEVYAHAVLGSHQHVVRYYSAWAEDDHMIIQNEYCNGGSLALSIEKKRCKNRRYTENQIKTILLHLAKGLKFIHSLHMVHLDIKPDNIFIGYEGSKHVAPNEESADDGFEDETFDELHTDFTYKIGDLGHVTSVLTPRVEDGDCRYLPREILQDDHSDLKKVDIFALGLTLYETASGVSLPLNGPEWQSIRDGVLAPIPDFSTGLQNLLKLMTHNDPKMRPSASKLINDEVFNEHASPGGVASKSKGQLSRELEAARLKNEDLEKQLQVANNFIKNFERGAATTPVNNCNKPSMLTEGEINCPPDIGLKSQNNDVVIFGNISPFLNSCNEVNCSSGDGVTRLSSTTPCSTVVSHVSEVNVCVQLSEESTTSNQNVKQYHYNTRSQQQICQQTEQQAYPQEHHRAKQPAQSRYPPSALIVYRPPHRFVGKKSIRSHSVL